MIYQPTFDDPPPAPAQLHSRTSRDAARIVQGRTPKLRGAVLAYLRSCGAQGATDEELQRGCDMAANTARPRRVELVQLGLVRDSGTTRSTASGRQATVWVVVGD